MPQDVHVSDLQAFSDTRFHRPPFVVKPIVVSGGIHIVYGREGAGKTQFVLTMARDIVNGSKLFGRYSCRAGRVCYFGVDMPLQMLQSRIQKLKPQIDEPENFLVAANDAPIDITSVMQNADWVQSIRDFDPDIVFVDTLHKIHHMDENVSQTVAVVFRHLKRVFGRDVAILLVHHEGKDNPDPDINRKDSDLQRGSSAWLADSDLGVRIKNFENAFVGNVVEVTFPRLRYCESQPKISLEMNENTLLLEPRG